MVAGVKRVLLPPHRVRVAKLVHLARRSRQAKQEVRPAMEELALRDAGGVALQACRAAAEAERATHGLEVPTLRLEVVYLLVHIVCAETE